METVVLVHGLWMTGLEMWLMKSRLQDNGYHVEQFTYSSLRHSPVENAEDLNQFLSDLPGDKIHLVAHSLGGIVLMHLFQNYPEQRSGNVVLLGSPVKGSAVAKFLAANPLTRWFLGHSMEMGLIGKVPEWSGKRPLGVIAGNHGPGVGSFLAQLDMPNDGTVAVSETQVQGATDQIELPVNHVSLVFSQKVTDHICEFLKENQFHS